MLPTQVIVDRGNKLKELGFIHYNNDDLYIHKDCGMEISIVDMYFEDDYFWDVILSESIIKIREFNINLILKNEKT
jgi:hypothetical protein